MPIDPNVRVEPVKPPSQPVLYTADDLQMRQFLEQTSRRRDPQRRASRRVTPRPSAADSQAIMRCALLLLLMALAAGCASGGAVPAPFPTPSPRPPSPEPPSSPEPPALSPLDRPAVVGTALSLRGAPYRNGGSDPSGFDCSGFVAYVFAQQGLYMPRTVSEQYAQGQPVGPDAVAPGDLVFFSTVAPGASHVGIAISPDAVRPRPQLQRRRPGRVADRVLLVVPLRRNAADPLVRGQPAPVFARCFVPPRPRPHPADLRKPLQTLTVRRVIVQNDSGLYGADAPSERHVRAAQGRPLAEGGHALVPGEGRGHLFVRPRSPVPLLQLQAAVGHPAAALHQDQAQHRLRAVFAGQHLRARRPFVPVLRGGLSHGRI